MRLIEEFTQLRQFQSLPKHARSIVFYAEDAASYGYFSSMINTLTTRQKLEICYVTSDAHDPIRRSQNPLIRPFYIGNGLVRTWFFLDLLAGVFIMTMPDLGTFHIKRSRVYPVHYLYIFHSMFSVHSYLRKGAVDQYDSVFCVGPHHIREIRATERVYGLRKKHLVQHGYSRLDEILAMSRQQRKRGGKARRKTILIAPSFGPNALLEQHGERVIVLLLRSGCRVIVRPHPVTARSYPQLINRLVGFSKKNPSLHIERDIRSFASLLTADCMISDWSGVSLEYAFGTERPVLFVDVPKKNLNPDVDAIGIQPIEIGIRKKIGRVVSPSNLESIPHVISSLCAQRSSWKQKIAKTREQTVYNIGRSGVVGADAICTIVDRIQYEKTA